MKEITHMNTNTMELNMNEMEKVNGALDMDSNIAKFGFWLALNFNSEDNKANKDGRENSNRMLQLSAT